MLSAKRDLVLAGAGVAAVLTLTACGSGSGRSNLPALLWLSECGGVGACCGSRPGDSGATPGNWPADGSLTRGAKPLPGPGGALPRTLYGGAPRRVPAAAPGRPRLLGARPGSWVLTSVGLAASGARGFATMVPGGQPHRHGHQPEHVGEAEDRGPRHPDVAGLQVVVEGARGSAEARARRCCGPSRTRRRRRRPARTGRASRPGPCRSRRGRGRRARRRRPRRQWDRSCLPGGSG